MKKKQCRACGGIKPLDKFNRMAAGKDGYATMCKACKKIKRQENRVWVDLDPLLKTGLEDLADEMGVKPRAVLLRLVEAAVLRAQERGITYVPYKLAQKEGAV